MKRILIAKPNNNIYLKNREDETKTDLQSGEIIAFTNAILQAVYGANLTKLEIHHANDYITCINNNLHDGSLRRSFFPNNPHLKQFWLYDNISTQKSLDDAGFDESSILFVFCGIWNDSKMCKDLLSLIAGFKGRVYYVLNDLRLDIPSEYIEIFKYANVEVLTQAKTFVHKSLRTRTMDFEMLPYWYIKMDSPEILKIYDICYPVLNFKDIGDYRKNVLKKLSDVDGVKKLWIGDTPNWSGNDNFFETQIKYDQLHNTVKKCRASFIVNEEVYNQNQLIPNRFMESLMIGTIPLFHRETAEAVKKHINIEDFNIDNYIVNDDFSNLKELVNNYELLWKTQEIGQKLRNHDRVSQNTTQKFKKQILTLIDENEHQYRKFT